jgi:hypothetical protein
MVINMIRTLTDKYKTGNIRMKIQYLPMMLKQSF